MIISIEFDVNSGFDTIEQCQKWLQNSCYSYMLNFKNFTLRKRKSGLWISGEKRPIIGWQGALWKYRSLKVSRPEPGIVVVECGPGDCGVFLPAELPSVLAETAQKNADREAKKNIRKKQREIKRQEQREKRGTIKQSKKRQKKEPEPQELYPATQDPTPTMTLSDIPPAIYLKSK